MDDKEDREVSIEEMKQTLITNLECAIIEFNEFMRTNNLSMSVIGLTFSNENA